MKKKSIFYIVLAAILILAAAPASYAYYVKTRSIPNVRITVSTKDLDIGTDLTGSAENYVSIPDGNQYYELDYAEWMDDVTYLKVGDTPRMRVALTAIPKETESSNYSTIYLFSGSYNKSNVSVNGGEFISSSKWDSGYTLVVTIRVKPLKGTFDEPYALYWTNERGVARWERAYNDSGYYDVTLYRGSSAVKRLTSYHGNVYNFYPYMTQSGEYTFRVRTVQAPGSSGGKASSWAESSGYYIDAWEVSDGSGQTSSDESYGSANQGQNTTTPSIGNSDQYGWINQGGQWYFRYPDRTLATGWKLISGNYYRFDADGRMLTGWFKNDYGYWFYLNNSTGAMVKGWLYVNGYTYYLRPDGGDYEGTMVTGIADIEGKRYYFEPDGRMGTGWKGVNGKYYYFYPQTVTGGAYGYMAVNTQVGDFYVGADGAWIP